MAATFTRIVDRGRAVTCCVTPTLRATVYVDRVLVGIGAWSDSLRGFARLVQLAPLDAEVRSDLERAIATQRRRCAA